MPTPKSHFDRLPGKRQKPVADATKGCWDGTQAIVAEVVHESRGQPVWKPVRAATMLAQNNADPFMYPEEFARWRIMAKGLARAMKLVGHPREIMGFSTTYYRDLGNAARCAKKGYRISKVYALACAHFSMGYDAPTDAAGLKPWFWERFAQLASAADALDLDKSALSSYLHGYRLEQGEKVLTPAPPYVIRALDWLWRNGPSSPYGPRPEYYPSAAIPPADEET